MPNQERWYGEQSRRDPYSRRDDRGFMDRAGDEVRSWFGDDESERRRRMDERDERYRDEDYRRGSSASGSDRDVPRYSDRGYGSGERAGRGAYESGWDPGTGRRLERGGYDVRGGYGGSGGYGYGGSSGPGSYGYGQESQRYGRQFGSRESEGRFAGQGPKGYQRSDDRIREDVCDRLADAPDLDASEIEIAVRQGEVTLSGTVHERGDKRRAEDIIESISGVREVHNTLRTKERGSRQDTAGAGGEQGASTETGRRTTGAAGGR